MKTPKRSQTTDVLQYMRDYDKITSLDAIREFGATRLSAIIYLLRHKSGYDIETIKKVSRNSYGNTVHYAEYWLHEEEENDN